MRAMCDQSKFNYVSGGLLAPRGFLILLFKDWKLLIVPLLYQGDVFTNKWAASSPQKTRTAKAIDQSILQAREILLSGPLCAQQGCCSQTTFKSSGCCPGASDWCPCVRPSQCISEPTTLPCTGGEVVPSSLTQAELQLCADAHPSSLGQAQCWQKSTSEGRTAQPQPCHYAAQTPSPHYTQQRSQVTLSRLFSQQRLLV